jgi:phage terminase large subunit
LSILDLKIPKAFKGIERPYRFKVFYGGRGGGKSETVARYLLADGLVRPLRILCTRELQTSIADSVHKLLADIIRSSKNLSAHYEILQTTIRGKNGTEFLFKGLKHNITEIKGISGIDRVFVEEAENISDRSWELLIPSIRKDGSEIWVVFNPRNASDPTYQRFIVAKHDDALVRKINWNDNPFFPDVLNKERLRLLETDPEAYEHIWQGQLDTRRSGAVYAKQIDAARKDGRVTHVPYDPSCEVFTAWDLGWSDSTTIWWAQFVGRELRVIDFYENSGEGLEHYARIIKEKPYNYMRNGHFLPHDAGAGNIRGDSVTVQLNRLGVDNQVLETSSVEGGIEAVRQLFPICVFDADKTKDGLFALENYAYEWDDDRKIFKKSPSHNWASHAADGFRYLAHATTRVKNRSGVKPVSFRVDLGHRGSYMGA